MSQFYVIAQEATETVSRFCYPVLELAALVNTSSGAEDLTLLDVFDSSP